MFECRAFEAEAEELARSIAESAPLMVMEVLYLAHQNGVIARLHDPVRGAGKLRDGSFDQDVAVIVFTVRRRREAISLEAREGIGHLLLPLGKDVDRKARTVRKAVIG